MALTFAKRVATRIVASVPEIHLLLQGISDLNGDVIECIVTPLIPLYLAFKQLHTTQLNHKAWKESVVQSLSTMVAYGEDIATAELKKGGLDIVSLHLIVQTPNLEKKKEIIQLFLNVLSPSQLNTALVTKYFTGKKILKELQQQGDQDCIELILDHIRMHSPSSYGSLIFQLAHDNTWA